MIPPSLEEEIAIKGTEQTSQRNSPGPVETHVLKWHAEGHIPKPSHVCSQTSLLHKHTRVHVCLEEMPEESKTNKQTDRPRWPGQIDHCGHTEDLTDQLYIAH